MGRKRSTRINKYKRLRRKTFRQRGGYRGLLDNADAPPIGQATPIDFNVRFQPTIKAREDGPTFTTYQTAHEPYPVWTAPTPPTMYTILCWDPDVPKKSFLHWMIVNCATADNSDGKVVASWTPPSPPPGTGEHRYIIGLFKQNGPVNVEEIVDRTGFNPTTFSTQHNLSALAYKGFRVKSADGPAPVAHMTATHSVLPPLHLPRLSPPPPPPPPPLPLPLTPPV
jgi:phosphatidylethanolamine-binding protein (PEBP) family uncharacterized protein